MSSEPLFVAWGAGTSYCTSAGRAFTLVVTNILRVAVVNTVGDALIFLAKLTVVGGCGVSAFFLSGIKYHTSPLEYPDSYLSSPMVPVIGTALCAYFIATLFFHVYEMAVDTILLSFCDDCDANGGEPKYAPEKLMKVMGATAPKHQSNPPLVASKAADDDIPRD
jgi:choline transporter-like protein 2/4/5